MEYEVYLLDPTRQLCHIGEKLYEHDNLAWAITFAQRYHLLHRTETCVWQPRNITYRDYYKNDPELL